MILLGLAADPFLVCPLLPKGNWSLNSLDKRTAVFVGLQAFTSLRQPSPNNRVLIFDNQERCESLQGLHYIADVDPIKAHKRVQAYKTTLRTTQVRSRDFIAELIEKHKDRSVMHLYNTYLYKIKFQPTRNGIKEVYLAYLNSEIDRAEFDKRMQGRYPTRGEAKEAVDFLMQLTTTPQFVTLRDALIEVKAGNTVEAVALKHKIERFDLNYLLHNSNP